MLPNTRFLSFTSLGRAHSAPRIWCEGDRLTALNFGPGARFSVTGSGSRLTLKADATGDRTVSYRRNAAGIHPIIDLNSARVLGGLSEFETIKVAGSFGRLDLSPSIRAFHVARARRAEPPFHITEFCCGGGSLSRAFSRDCRFLVTAGVDVSPDYLNVWEKAHPEAVQIQGDMRAIHPSELPARLDVLVAGLPCTSHSAHGRAKKGLAGTPELGDTGDLFVSFLGVVMARMPLAIVVENVALFGSSLAGQLLVTHLERLGYSVTTTVLQPHDEWGQISDRRRYCLVATLTPGFSIQAPGVAFAGTAASVLDPIDLVQDAADADRIANTVVGLDRHNARHAALGHGFKYAVIDRDSTSIPVLTKSYHKINLGPFVRCADGRIRMLRQGELERIHGTTVATTHFATAAEIIGQGVQEPVWAEIARQLADHLTGVSRPAPAATSAVFTSAPNPAEEVGQMALFA